MTASDLIQRGLVFEEALRKNDNALAWIMVWAENSLDGALSQAELNHNLNQWYAGYAAACRDLTKLPRQCISEKDSELIRAQQEAAVTPESPTDDAPAVSQSPHTI